MWRSTADKPLDRPEDGERVWVAKAGTKFRGIATYDRVFDRFFVGENDVTCDVTHWAPCKPPEGPLA